MVPGRIVLCIAQMLAHLGFQCPLQHRLGQLFEQPVFPDDLLGALIILQQLIDQRLVDSHESFSFSHGRLHSSFYSSSRYRGSKLTTIVVEASTACPLSFNGLHRHCFTASTTAALSTGLPFSARTAV